MNLAPFAPVWLLCILTGLLLLAAVQDFLWFRISNLTTAAVLLSSITAVFIAGPRLEMWQNGMVFLLVLVAGTLLFSSGKLGGGDVKLFAAVAPWFKLSGALIFTASVFIAGGILAVVYLIVGRLRKRPRNPGEKAMRRKVPYGIAIAGGAALALYVTAQPLHGYSSKLPVLKSSQGF